MRYFLHLAYDGTRYAGWQVQPNARTVQSELDRCLSLVLRQPVHVQGSGRTDAGVHASHQVAHFEAEIPADLPPDQLLHRLRRVLPPDIAPLRLHPVPDDAHARFSAEERSYEYFVLTAPDPFRHDFALFIDRPLDVAAMNAAAAHLVGTHDFTTFSKVKGAETHYVCHCHEAGWHPAPGGLVFRIRANRFVRGMVRLVVGTLLDVGRGKRTPVDFQQLLQAKNRIEAGNAAPAAGLFLSRVIYAAGVVPEAEYPQAPLGSYAA